MVLNMRGLHRVLKMLEYPGIYLKKQSAQYARILNVSDAVHSISSLYNYGAVIGTETYSERCQTSTEERFAKRRMP